MYLRDFPEAIPPAPSPNSVFVYMLVAANGAYYVGSARDVGRGECLSLLRGLLTS